MTSETFTRSDLLSLLAAVGGHGANLDAADDVMLTAIVSSRIALVTDIAVIDAALLLRKELPVEWRAALMGRRIELAQLARVAAAPKKVEPRPAMAVFGPPSPEAMTHFVDGNGRTHEVRIENGRRDLKRTVLVRASEGFHAAGEAGCTCAQG